jgi:hypothetical protein
VMSILQRFGCMDLVLTVCGFVSNCLYARDIDARLFVVFLVALAAGR